MHCGLCQKPASGDRPLTCSLCAGMAVYQPRLDLVQSLLENERLGQQVEKEIVPQKPQKTGFLTSKAPETNVKWAYEGSIEASNDVEAKTQEILAHTKLLREEIQHMRLDIAKRRAQLNRRRKDQASARQELSEAHQVGDKPIRKDCDEITRYWERLQSHTRQVRLENCSKTARLFSLNLEERRAAGSKKPSYSIGFLPIPDLRELNNAHPTQLTATLLHLANLVHMTSHHLGLKLPAQIMLPTSSCAKPLILSQTASYTTESYMLPSSHGSSSRSTAQRSQPRARPLFVDKSLAAMAKDEPLNYALAVEGITLLAWDIAWLCKTQGHDIGRGSWEEVCAMGRNLHRLLLPSSSKPHISATSSTTSSQATATGAKSEASMGYPKVYTHASQRDFLGASEGVEYMRGWNLGNSIKVIHRVKAMLLAERTGAEWELLDGDDWAEDMTMPLDGTNEGSKPVGNLTTNGHVVKNDASHSRTVNGDFRPKGILEQTGILVKAEAGAGVNEKEDERGKGGSGWTKIRGR